MIAAYTAMNSSLFSKSALTHFIGTLFAVKIEALNRALAVAVGIEFIGLRAIARVEAGRNPLRRSDMDRWLECKNAQ